MPVRFRGRLWGMVVSNGLAVSKSAYGTTLARAKKGIDEGRYPPEVMERLLKDVEETLPKLKMFQPGGAMRTFFSVLFLEREWKADELVWSRRRFGGRTFGVFHFRWTPKICQWRLAQTTIFPKRGMLILDPHLSPASWDFFSSSDAPHQHVCRRSVREPRESRAQERFEKFLFRKHCRSELPPSLNFTPFTQS